LKALGSIARVILRSFANHMRKFNKLSNQPKMPFLVMFSLNTDTTTFHFLVIKKKRKGDLLGSLGRPLEKIEI
jgi:hypothetical protein